MGMRDHGSDGPGDVRCVFGHMDVPALLPCWTGLHKYRSVKQLWIYSYSGNDALKRRCSICVYELCLSKDMFKSVKELVGKFPRSEYIQTCINSAKYF